jgi:hypothetical protein
MARPGSPTLLFTHEQHVVRCRGGYYNPAGMIGS